MLVFLKLGGSLITDKNTPLTPKINIISNIAKEIKTILNTDRQLKMIIGHGSGSFGHSVAKIYNTVEGAKTSQDWEGFIKVWEAARALNQIVIEQFIQNGVPALSFSPSAMTISHGQKISSWDISSIQMALSAGLIPLIHGDVVFDTQIGATILSTEKLFFHLATRLKPNKILISGIEKGVWQDFPACTKIIKNITPSSYPNMMESIQESASVDVTGGMLAKVSQMVDLVNSINDLEVQIFPGEDINNFKPVIAGKSIGTMISRT
ncbi:MAG: isopentenyl phosphate kinase family protein [Anaerolineaceae bacterium]|nr:isopentenyl phosphate kinase family protein [Anaerolineaceae bacterium]